MKNKLFIYTPKLAEKILKQRRKRCHYCQKTGWWTACELEPPCVWLEDIVVRGYPWGCE